MIAIDYLLALLECLFMAQKSHFITFDWHLMSPEFHFMSLEFLFKVIYNLTSLKFHLMALECHLMTFNNFKFLLMTLECHLTWLENQWRSLQGNWTPPETFVEALTTLNGTIPSLSDTTMRSDCPIIGFWNHTDCHRTILSL